MAKNLKTIPATPCCDACVLNALTRASFDYSEPFVVYSNLRALPARARRELVDQLLAHAEGDVVVMVSSPVPAELRESATSTPAVDAELTDAAAPSASELNEMFGLDRNEA